MVAPGQRLPDYREAPENAREQYYENKVIQTKQRHPYPLMVLTGVLAAGAVGTFVASTQTRKTYLSPNTAGSELRSLRTTTNLLYGVSVGVGVGAVGAGVATVVTW